MKNTGWLFTIVFLSAALFLPLAPTEGQMTAPTTGYHLVRGWPRLPEGYVLGQVSGVTVDSHNHVFVFHRTARSSRNPPKAEGAIPDATVLCFDGETGALVTQWGAGAFRLPHGITADAENNLWLTDREWHQVFKYSHDGKLLLTLGERGVRASDGRHFGGPSGVAVARDGSIYVSDGYDNSRVAKFSSSGEFLFDWGKNGSGPGEFGLVHAVALDQQGRVYVADRANARIEVFTPEGKFLTEWKSAALGRPWGVAIGGDGYAYVVDGGDLKLAPPDRAHVLKVDLTGKVIDSWASYGNYDGQIYWGHDIAVGRDGAVYVGDILGQRVQKFAPGR